MNQKKELRLVEQAKNSLKAFDELYEHYLPRIFGYVYNRIGNKELAEDLTSHTFVKAMTNIKTFEPRGISFGAWLYRIAHNNIIDHVRKHKKKVSMEIKDIDLKVDEHQPKEYEQFEKKSIIREALGKLHSDYQQILSLKFFEEMENQEIADIMGIKKATLAVKLHRSLNALRKILKNDYYKFQLGIE